MMIYEAFNMNIAKRKPITALHHLQSMNASFCPNPDLNSQTIPFACCVPLVKTKMISVLFTISMIHMSYFLHLFQTNFYSFTALEMNPVLCKSLISYQFLIFQSTLVENTLRIFGVMRALLIVEMIKRQLDWQLHSHKAY